MRITNPMTAKFSLWIDDGICLLAIVFLKLCSSVEASDEFEWLRSMEE
eukprot:CAMPEP_0202976612 /NCGR_PEP_ID=MMETSP1396-20130829/79029_1 /ASSEMBLY_ACC=CAM_ASM_000872 /TAXON_ID= /ORGANISM="Pseudokeronopsis sp., Strain Brazil" /LENGTH=47 /DNA_ID= /DNA_START= /DNA_END= /DNA_ORIENTATION=